MQRAFVKSKTGFRLVLAATLLLILTLVIEAAPRSGQVPAHFRVTAETVNADLQAFTATIDGFGNSLTPAGAGFEPIVFRDRYLATEDAPDRVVVEASTISNWDTFREGLLDGAEVRVYRIADGQLRLVREDRVAAGGSHASGWLPASRQDMVVPADHPSFTFRWEEWNRPDASYYFTVRAVDGSGNYSAPAKAVEVKSPARLVSGEVDNGETPYSQRSLTLDSTPPAAPASLRGKLTANGGLTLTWQRPDDRDVAGYVVYRSDYPPEQHRGYYLQLANEGRAADQPIKAGDMVIVSKKFYATSRSRYFTNRVWGAENAHAVLQQPMIDFFPDEQPEQKSWALVKHDKGTRVEQPGETFLEVRLGAGQGATVGSYNHSGTAQDWYPVLEKNKKYKMEVWLRKSGAGQVRFGSDDQPEGLKRDYLPADGEWRKFVTTFTPRGIDTSDRPYQMRLELTGPGSFSIDNLRIYEAGSEFLDLLPRDYQRLRQSGIMALRTHGLVRTEKHSYDIEQLTNPGGVISGTTKLNTLPQSLAAMRKAKVRPWLQIEPHLSPSEWSAFIEYMAAPYDPAKDTATARPWAFKRYQQGQRRPWAEEFDKIYLELGNETWNNLFSPWGFDDMTDAATGRRYTAGEVYGLMQQHVIATLRSSPYWQAAGLSDKIEFVLGGWNSQDYGRQAASTSPDSHYLTIAAYNGGWDEAEGPARLDNESFYYVLNQVSQSGIPGAEQLARQADEIGRSQGRTLLTGTYEAGPGYVMNGLNGAAVTPQQAAEQERVMKSQAAGTATLDAFLARAYRGFRLQNFFAYDEGSYWKSHATWYNGGQAYPSWLALSLFNREATGDMLKTETLSVPMADLAPFARRAAVADAPQVAVYATRKGERLCLFVLSRKLANYPDAGDSGYTPVTVDLPIASARQLTLYRMSADPRADNVNAVRARVDTLPLPVDGIGPQLTLSAKTGASDKGLPPGSVFLYVFDGVTGT